MWNKVKNNLQFLPAGGAAEAMAEDIIHAMAEELLLVWGRFITAPARRPLPTP